MNDQLPSQLLISQSISVPLSKEMDIHELWELHDRAMSSFREEFDKISSIDELPPRAPSSLLDLKVAISEKILQNCHFCERRCGINRKKKETGYC
ncbi:MAG: radical SAM protein, partial [Candidatus Methanoperedens sp.]|nr:radical SAM protein [Candidatus Methanoperedens sp.]